MKKYTTILAALIMLCTVASCTKPPASDTSDEVFVTRTGWGPDSSTFFDKCSNK